MVLIMCWRLVIQSQSTLPCHQQKFANVWSDMSQNCHLLLFNEPSNSNLIVNSDLLLVLVKVGLFHSFARETGKAGMNAFNSSAKATNSFQLPAPRILNRATLLSFMDSWKDKYDYNYYYPFKHFDNLILQIKNHVQSQFTIFKQWTYTQ